MLKQQELRVQNHHPKKNYRDSRKKRKSVKDKKNYWLSNRERKKSVNVKKH